MSTTSNQGESPENAFIADTKPPAGKSIGERLRAAANLMHESSHSKKASRAGKPSVSEPLPTRTESELKAIAERLTPAQRRELVNRPFGAIQYQSRHTFGGIEIFDEQDPNSSAMRTLKRRVTKTARKPSMGEYEGSWE